MIRSDDSAAIGEQMSGLVKELRKCSDTKVQSGFFGWLFRRRDRKKFRKQCETAVQNADRVAAELEKHRNRLLRDFVMLDKLYDSVLEQYRELTVFTEAGQRKLEEDTSADKEIAGTVRKASPRSETEPDGVYADPDADPDSAGMQYRIVGKDTVPADEYPRTVEESDCTGSRHEKHRTDHERPAESKRRK